MSKIIQKLTELRLALESAVTTQGRYLQALEDLEGAQEDLSRLRSDLALNRQPGAGDVGPLLRKIAAAEAAVKKAEKKVDAAQEDWGAEQISSHETARDREEYD